MQTELNRYLLENFNVVLIDETKNIEPQNLKRSEVVYLMGLYGYRPDNDLLEEMRKDKTIGDKIVGIMKKINPNAIELLSEYYPINNPSFSIKYINDIIKYNETGSYNMPPMEAIVTPKTIFLLRKN